MELCIKSYQVAGSKKGVQEINYHFDHQSIISKQVMSVLFRLPLFLFPDCKKALVQLFKGVFSELQIVH